MRDLTLHEKISIKGKLVRKGYVNPRLTMAEAMFIWPRCYGTSIRDYHLVPDNNTKRRTSLLKP